ncbi:hypothetical protein KY312_03220 [Candidatus Woesearchaeota archaeon]|nr:hypothetical protein [Candidatus Woesearchaeota archaeon]
MSILLQLIDTDFCKECKDCCRFHPECTEFAPVFAGKDKKHLINKGFDKKNFFKNKKGEWVSSFKKKQGIYHLCPFLEKERCTAQEIKPFNCIIYPVVVMRSRDNKKTVVAIDESCKAIKNKKLVMPIEKYIKYLKKLFNSKETLQEINRLSSHIEPYQNQYKIIFEL